MNLELLRGELERDEGRRLRPYEDIKGKITIGVGRNLTDVGISEEECALLLDNDIKHAWNQACRDIITFNELSEVRQRVIVNMCFNLGSLKGWPHFVVAVNTKDFNKAVEIMRGSRWHQQVGSRALRLEAMMENGDENTGTETI